MRSSPVGVTCASAPPQQSISVSQSTAHGASLVITERAVEARMDTGGSVTYCRAPAVLGTDEMPIATRGGDVDIARVLDCDRHQSLRLERLKPWAAASAGKRKGRKEGRGAEGRSRPN